MLNAFMSLEIVKSIKTRRFGAKSVLNSSTPMKIIPYGNANKRYPVYKRPPSRRELMLMNMKKAVEKEKICMLASSKSISPRLRNVIQRNYTISTTNRSIDKESDKNLNLQESSIDNSTFEATSHHMSTRDDL